MSDDLRLRMGYTASAVALTAIQSPWVTTTSLPDAEWGVPYDARCSNPAAARAT